MNTLINYLFASLKYSAPYMLGTTGEIVTQKSGSINLGVEGLMAIGAFAGYYFACKTGNLWMGIVMSFIFAMGGGLIYAFITVTLQANQNVTGLTLTTFGLGMSSFLGQKLSLQSMRITGRLTNQLQEIPWKGLGEIPFIGRFLFSQNMFVHVAIVICFITWVYLSFTKAGLKTRAIGENPRAADASGVRVALYKYSNILLGAGICGIGGAYIALVIHGNWLGENIINGAGWVSIALVIFAAWSPAKAVFGSFLFGMFSALQVRAGDLALAFPSVLSWLSEIPGEFYKMLPFVLTALVLIISSIKKQKEGTQPLACGLNYYREDR